MVHVLFVIRHEQTLNYSFHIDMDDGTPDEVFADLKTKDLGGWGVAQIAAGTGLAVYVMWAGILQPGFRKVPLKLQVWSLQHLIFH